MPSNERARFSPGLSPPAHPYTPVWLMRQAGRYMPEYRAVRDKVSFLELCKTPELAAQVTVEAVERLGVDAAIIFADILLIVEPMGVGLEFAQGDGPVIHRPLRSGRDIDRLHARPAAPALALCLRRFAEPGPPCRRRLP